MKKTAYLGSYTDNGGAGLDVASVDAGTGTVLVDTAVGGVPDGSWLAFSLDRRVLYSTNELDPNGTVTALSLDDPARPTVLDAQPTRGALPTHLSVHPSGKYLLVANYGSGSVTVLPLAGDGTIGPATDLVQHAGGSGGTPHAHQIVTDPSGKWVLSVDLGTDSVYVYRLDLDTGKLTLHDQVVVAAGTGPRHLAFHPNATRGYLLCENASHVVLFAWNTTTGKLTPGEIVGTQEPGATTPNYPAEITLSDDARFAYVSNRGDNSVATFSVGDDGAGLLLLATVPTGGDWPRHLAVHPNGHWVIVSNQRSGAVTWLPRDPHTGAVSAVAGSVPVPAVAMVLFA